MKKIWWHSVQELRSMKRDLIGLVGIGLFIAGCVLFGMVSQTANHAYLFQGQVAGGGTEYFTATPDKPSYPFAQQMWQLWSPEALVYVNLYLSVLAVCVGVTLVLISIRGLGTRDGAKPSWVSRAGWIALVIALVIGVVLANAFGREFLIPLPPWDPSLYIFALLSPFTALDLLALSVLIIPVSLILRSRLRRAGWVALLLALLFGVMLANVAGQAFPPLDPCWGVLGCPPWNLGPFGPPIGALLHTAPMAVLAALVISVLLSLVGCALAWRTRGALTPVVVRLLQLAPLLVVTLIGLAALFLFPLPYSLPHTL
jgi:hypothetical protein